MKDKIYARVDAWHVFECDTNIIGRSGEGGTAQLEIALNDEMSNCSVYLDFEKSNGDKFRTPRLKAENNVVVYDVPAYLLSESGELKVQLVLKAENGGVWKSFVKKFANLESINATTTLMFPEKYDGAVIFGDGDESGDSGDSGDSTTITFFTIDGKSYQSEAGWTWAEWCDSTYNKDGYWYDGVVYDNNYNNGSYNIVRTEDGSSVIEDTEITANGVYYCATEPTIEPATITFTINGKSYQADTGMTWAEWCESAYNTLGLVETSTAIETPDGSKWIEEIVQTVPNVDGMTAIEVNGAYKLVGNEPTTITFTIEVTPLEAENTSWIDWCNSSYNKVGAECDATTGTISKGEYVLYIGEHPVDALLDGIIAGGIYSWRS